jgi:16S rRNA pseudouridine516 synthase
MRALKLKGESRMRLDKFLAESGKGTRSEVKKMISKGRVNLNGLPVKDPSFKVDPEKDVVKLDGETVVYAAFEYFMLNKPAGVISASKADLRNPDELCVTDLIKEKLRDDLFPVGRLDKDTVGLLLITNDGELAHRLLSPKRHVDKTYYVKLSSAVSPEDISKLEKGVDIGDDKPTLPCRILPVSDTGPGDASMGSASPSGRSFYITIHEGRFHQIKRMFAACGTEVIYLKRLSMGSLLLDEKLGEGEYRRLTWEELLGLRACR